MKKPLHSVSTYLTVLFSAALLLLVLAYFMQVRMGQAPSPATAATAAQIITGCCFT